MNEGRSLLACSLFVLRLGKGTRSVKTIHPDAASNDGMA
eukprot:CAMPEP_0206137330 /NCGR_PEP_ID=MMETSP1473-20131121/2478_1 /ASSEMBLY_ACC=CAM_ASM_001109 /TAXON_ID=1461547 /ORGANISM="Stichococcus sp, Strain RCC1054" /LENGTH=38 /DNA_ID= /DNA_START= /DNA_END= /DNA_ORIENTATION=